MKKTFLMRAGRLSFFLFLLILLPQKVLAGDVVINEFLVDPDSAQWVELYNKGTIPIDIGSWFIDDDGGTQKFTIPSGTLINPSEYKIFESGFFNLNRTTADTVKLLNGMSLEDSYSYTTGPGPNKSYGRDIDGVGEWAIFNNPTKGSANNSSTPMSLPTPTPSLTPTPSPTPKPTKPAPTKSPTKAPITSAPTQKISSPIPPARQVLNAAINPKINVPTSVLGQSTKSAVATSSSGTTDSNKEVKTLGSSQDNIFKVLIGVGGLFIITCAILLFRHFKNKKINNE